MTIHIAGRLGQNPEVTETKGGTKATKFSVAMDSYKDGASKTMWFSVVFFGERYNRMLQCLKKGSAVMIVGSLSPVKVYQARNGEYRASLDVIGEVLSFSPFGGDKKEDNNNNNQSNNNRSEGQSNQVAVPMEEDEMPF